MSNRYVVIMAGGTGTRLWPLSRQAKPKQFLKLLAETSLFEETYAHVRRVLPVEQIFVMADAPRMALVREQLPEIPVDNLIIEPSSRDNGPAIGLASSIIERRHPGALLAVIWSDHRVTKGDNFARSLETTFQALADYPDHLVTIGIKPTRPATEFGYLKIGHELNLDLPEPVFSVERFQEKPDLATATRWVSDWRYLWNTGVKVYRARHMLELFAIHQPQDFELLRQISERQPTEPIIDLWEQMTKKDIEHLITEKVADILVVPADLGWNDIGNWSVVHDVLRTEQDENMVVRAPHVDIGSRQCLVLSDGKLIATAGLSDIIIVDTPDALLVINRAAAQDVKLLVDQVRELKASLL